MADRVVTQKNAAGGRFLNSIKGVFVGIAIVFICSILLVCNEKSSAQYIGALKEAERNYTKVFDAKASSENNGKLVAIEGGALTFTPVNDEFYGVAFPSFHLERTVEFYQRQQTKSGSSTDAETSYKYTDVWSSSRIDSSGFYDASEKNANDKVPTGAQYQSGSIVSKDLKLGEFTLTPEQGAKISASTGGAPSSTTATGFKVSGNYIVNADQGSSPKIGDVRISYSFSDAATASAIAQQSGTNLADYKAKNGGIIRSAFFPGNKTGEEMFDALRDANKITTWIFRILLAIFICIGFSMLLTPVQVLVSFIPFLGKYIGKFTGTVAGVIGGIIGAALSLLIIAVSWVMVRPLVGIPLLVITIGLIIIASKFGKKKEAAA